jgi:hypothetical protein
MYGELQPMEIVKIDGPSCHARCETKLAPWNTTKSRRSRSTCVQCSVAFATEVISTSHVRRSSITVTRLEVYVDGQQFTLYSDIEVRPGATVRMEVKPKPRGLASIESGLCTFYGNLPRRRVIIPCWR